MAVHNAPPTDVCVIGQFHLGSHGYPMIRYEGQMRLVTHVLMELAGNPKPDGLEYAHSDDCQGDRRCINIRHGRWASSAQNKADNSRLLKIGNMKLDHDKVATIRSRYADGGISQRALGREFEVSQRCIHAIIHNRTWRTQAQN